LKWGGAMRKFLLLFKVQLFGLFGINKMLHAKTKDEKSRAAVVFASWACGFIALFMYSAFISIGSATIGAAYTLPVSMLTLSSVLTLFLTFFEINGLLFSLKDYDLVMSLPVSPRAVILSRVAVIYVMDFLFSFIAIVPAIFIYGAYTKAPLPVYFIQFTGVFLAPLIPIAISAGIGAIIMAISARFKYINIAAIIMSMAALTLITVFSININNQMPQEFLDIIAVTDAAVTKAYPPAYFYRVAVTSGSWAYLLIFAGMSLAAMALFVFLLGKFYLRINSAVSSRKQGAKYSLGKKTGTPFTALYKKELRRLFSCPVYALNACFGMVFLIALSVISLFVDITGTLSEIGALDVKYILPFVMAFFPGMSITTASSISLEGKSRWLMCGAPVDQETVYKSKIAVNLTVCLPLLVISGILLSISFKAGFLGALFMVALPAAYSVFSAVTGLFINLKFPKYDWTSEFHVVKNSAAVLFSLLMGMSAAVMLLIFGIALAKYAYIYQTVCIIIILGAAYALYAAIRGKRLYM